MNVSEALASRMSCRAFLPKPVPYETVRTILYQAGRAPSGGNLQPWHVYAVSGKALEALRKDVALAMKDRPRGGQPQYRIYPKDLTEPYFSRRSQCGEDLYAAINVARDDKKGRLAQFRENFRSFGAPVALFFYIDSRMEPGQWADVGIYMQSVMLLAREYGLHSCAQEVWAVWHDLVARHLTPPAQWLLFSGMALGYRDENHPINRLRTQRAKLEEYCNFKGFEQ